jgi:hypothetical protein
VLAEPAGTIGPGTPPWVGWRDRIIDRVEYLETQPVSLQAQMHDLGKIAGIDIAPGIALPRGRVFCKP